MRDKRNIPQPGVYYGIYNTVARKWQFGICEVTAVRAERALYKKIGKNSYRWRFEIKRLPKPD